MSVDTLDLLIRGVLVVAILWAVFRSAEASERTRIAMRDLDEAIKKFEDDA